MIYYSEYYVIRDRGRDNKLRTVIIAGLEIERLKILTLETTEILLYLSNGKFSIRNYIKFSTFHYQLLVLISCGVIVNLFMRIELTGHWKLNRFSGED